MQIVQMLVAKYGQYADARYYTLRVIQKVAKSYLATPPQGAWEIMHNLFRLANNDAALHCPACLFLGLTGSNVFSWFVELVYPGLCM